MVPWRRRAALLMLSVMIVACGQGAGEEDIDTKEEAPAIPVEITTPSRGDIYAVYSGTAPIEAFADAQVIAKVGGEVREIYVEEGDDVVAGQVLLRLDGDRLRFEAQQAEANLLKLQRDFQRNLDLKDRSLISAGDFEKIQYEMEALQATASLAKLELSYTEIRAPIAGIVSHRYVKVGNTIEVNAPTFQITSLEPLVSYLHVPEREYRRIERGQTATIAVDALQGIRFEGTIARVSPVVDPLTGTFKITIEVSDSSRSLKPGMFGRISIVYDKHENALQIPRNAILQEAGEPAVFVVNGDTAHRRPVSTGYVQGTRIEILDGLADGDRLVLVGQTGLKDGSKVSVINADEADISAASTNLPASE
ncbi:MAG TPA: efflux RND transporter periplasmic adaptor subunit [Woeseiaceae bacterium]|nr:efflux RND transporter periplasmic adaptor subunit [Woeseiaceae bacterium]